MVRRALLALLVGLLMLPAGAIPAAAPPETLSEKAAATRGIRQFSTFYTMRHVRRLAGRIGPRVRGTNAEKRAARYFRRKLQDKGYVTNVQRFKVDGGSSRNVVAWWPGARRYPVVLGAHMDTVAGAPGANDNASGVAILIDIARALAGRRHVRNVRLVAFGSEEYGSNGVHHVGSHVFVNRLGKKGRRRLAGMVSVDMVADGRPLIIGTAGIGPPVVARTLYHRLKRAGFNVVYRTTCDCSDNGPFELAGIPGSFMWTGFEPNYHDASDTVANISRQDLRRSGRAVSRFVRGLDLKTLRRFRAKG
ncbi:MAG: M20/M25/M40 family metallo-hydrolase [Actinomycetota bacterium]|nr:M20/M25/M40 family metallo-hydrolase [Actinomycetota bacterium]